MMEFTHPAPPNAIPLAEGQQLRIVFPDGSFATVACYEEHLQIVNYNGYLYDWHGKRVLLEQWYES